MISKKLSRRNKQKYVLILAAVFQKLLYPSNQLKSMKKHKYAKMAKNGIQIY